MYRRRRTALVLPPARRCEDSGAIDSSHQNNSYSGSGVRLLRSSGTVGASYISSSDSSSSRSSSPISRLPMHSRTGQIAPEAPANIRSSAGRRRELQHIESTTPLSQPTQARDTAHLPRCPLIATPKPMTRSRRRALLRSPIFRLVLSPSHTSPSHDTNTDCVPEQSVHSRSRISATSGERISVDDQRNENRSTVRRLRTTRSGRRAARLNSLSRRGPPPSAATEPANRSRESLDPAELRNALNAARSTNSDGVDEDCVICLDSKSNRSVILPCMHTFCFECIYRWLCINPSCPLCKRLASRIIYSILSDSEFSEMLVSELQDREASVHSHRTTGLPLTLDLVEEDEIPSLSDSSRQQSHHHFHYHLEAPSVRLLNYVDDVTHGSSARTSLFIPPILIPSDSSLTRSGSLTSVLDHEQHHSHRWTSDIKPDLERDITSNFLLTNESQRHRLEAFIRRELRVLAPWLAYSVQTGQTEPVLREQRTMDNVDITSPAVTAPLISGAPGLLTETPLLDELTTQVVHHLTTVSMRDEAALISFLSSLPALASPLVPTNYLSHFASELVRFARYAGTLEQYDSAVCLYRRRHLSSTVLPPPTARIDPRLAVYVASACWPRLRPGFSQPQGLITHPLINWLMHRLFVHLITGASHPSQINGTGEHPALIPEPFSFPAVSSPLCHPNCLRLSSLSRALLESLPAITRLGGSRSLPRTNSLGSSDSYTIRRMTAAELFPNRLLFQRVLSELIDQARFSEALASHFHQHLLDHYRSRLSESVSTASEPHDFNVDCYCSGRSGSVEIVHPRSPANLPTDPLKPALDAHPFALRRLNGLLLLFTARVPGPNGVSSDEDWLSELLHMPLLPITSRSPSRGNIPLIDLTTPRPRENTRTDMFGTNWSFLRQPPWSSALPHDPIYRSSATTRPIEVRDSANQGRLTSRGIRSSSVETGWRERSGSYVVISSDSENELDSNATATSGGLTTGDDDSGEGDSGPHSDSTIGAVDRSNQMATGRVVANNLGDIETTASNLSLGSRAAHAELTPTASLTERNNDTENFDPEPMEVDHRVEEVGPFAGSKRPTVPEQPSFSQEGINHVRPPKLIKVDNIFADLMLRLQQSYAPLLKSESVQRGLLHERKLTPTPRHSHHRRVRHPSRTRSPIRVDSSGSDCELVREYIHVDSRSSSYSSTCSSSSLSQSTVLSSSSSSDRPRSRSPVQLLPKRSDRPKRGRHHHKCRMCHFCRRRRFRHHRFSCCRKSKRHRPRVKRLLCHCCLTSRRRRTHHPFSRLSVLLNSSSSPIVISDDHSDSKDQCQVSNNHKTSASLHLNRSSSPSNHESVVKLELCPPTASFTSLSSTSSVGTELIGSTSTAFVSQNPTTRAQPKLPIFEPTTVDDFYRFLERFHPIPSPHQSGTGSPTQSSNTGLPHEQDNEETLDTHP